VFLKLLRRKPTLKTVADLVRLSPLLTFADTPVFAIEPPAGCAALATALAERCAAWIPLTLSAAPLVAMPSPWCPS
jgi:hypothetical protein